MNGFSGGSPGPRTVHPDGQWGGTAFAPRPGEGALAEMIRARAAGDAVRHAMTLGIGPLTTVLVDAAAAAVGRLGVTALTHDADEAVAFSRLLGSRSALANLLVWAAPAVVREVGGTRLAMYDPGSFASVSAERPDIVIVTGLPAALGGREGPLRQAAALAHPRSTIIVPSIAESEADAVDRWLATMGGGALADERAEGGLRHLVVGL